jgi:uncharacterized protein (TIGR00297 family)
MGPPLTKKLLRTLVFKTLDFSGFLAAGILGLLLLAFGGVNYFLLIFAFFVLSAVFTRFGESRKGVHRPRGWENVFANGLFPTFAAVLGRPDVFFGAICAISADKLAGEIGQTAKPWPRLITNLAKKVMPGTNGGITLLGEVSAGATGLFFGALAFLLFRSSPAAKYLLVGFLSGFLGANFDSLLGATLENRGLLTKHGVNFLASVFGGVIGAIFLT